MKRCPEGTHYDKVVGCIRDGWKRVVEHKAITVYKNKKGDLLYFHENQYVDGFDLVIARKKNQRMSKYHLQGKSLTKEKANEIMNDGGQSR